MGFAALRPAVFSATGRRHDQQRRPGCGCDGFVCVGQRRVADGGALVLAAFAQVRLGSVGHTHCGPGAAGQLGLGVVDGTGPQHGTVVSESVKTL